MSATLENCEKLGSLKSVKHWSSVDLRQDGAMNGTMLIPSNVDDIKYRRVVVWVFFVSSSTLLRQ